MATTLDYFRQFAPEFNTLSDPAVQTWIDIATDLVARMFFDPDERQKMCDALYAAHLIKLQEIYVEEGPGSGGSSSGGSGSIQPGGDLIREKEGDLERQYAASGLSAGSGTSSSTSASNPLATTYYGRLFLSISNAVVGAPVMTRMSAGA
jgi:hypothetical protein